MSAPAPLYAAMMQTIADSLPVIARDIFGASTASLRIDPRPLRTARLAGVETSGNALMIAGRPAFGALPKDELDRRITTLRGNGVIVGDLHALDQCPGALGLASVEERKACPTERTIIAAFGVLDSAATQAVVQVVIVAAANQGTFSGKVGRITPYEMAFREGRWVLVKLGQTIIVE